MHPPEVDRGTARCNRSGAREAEGGTELVHQEVRALFAGARGVLARLASARGVRAARSARGELGRPGVEDLVEPAVIPGQTGKQSPNEDGGVFCRAPAQQGRRSSPATPHRRNQPRLRSTDIR